MVDQLKQDFEAEILVLESLTAYFYLEIGKLQPRPRPSNLIYIF